MAMMGGGLIGPSSGAKGIQLSNSDGTDAFELKDSDGFVIFKVDSKGNIYTRREVRRI